MQVIVTHYPAPVGAVSLELQNNLGATAMVFKVKLQGQRKYIWLVVEPDGVLVTSYKAKRVVSVEAKPVARHRWLKYKAGKISKTNVQALVK